MKQVTYTHVDGTTTVFTANTAITVMEWDAETQSNVAVTQYVGDWGFGTWAKERLSGDEFQAFVAASTTWDTTNDHLIIEVDSFKTYWTEFVTHPSVVVEE